MPSDRRRRAFPSILLLVLGAALALVACRELTVPVQEVPEMIQALGYVHDIAGRGIADARVEVWLRNDPEGRGFSASAYTDKNGRFSIWVLNQPLEVSIDPPNGSELARYREEEVRFSAGVPREFPLIGIPFEGRVDAGGLEHHIAGSRIRFYTWVPRPGGSSDRVISDAVVYPGGYFWVRLPQEGNYQTRISGYGPSGYIDFGWPDSLSVSQGDSILLELPLVVILVEPTLKGEPLPAGDAGHFYCISELRHEDYGSERYRAQLRGDGATSIFRVPALRGSQEIVLEQTESPERWVPQRFDLAPIQGGEHFATELGLHELRVEVSDPNGDPVNGTLYLYNESSGSSEASQSISISQNLYWVNPQLHRMYVDGYDDLVDQELYFDVHGDTTITIQMVPREYLDQFSPDSPALPQSP